jgi:hypothetical protein
VHRARFGHFKDADTEPRCVSMRVDAKMCEQLLPIESRAYATGL